MKICAFVQSKFAKQTYAKESFNIRLFAGLSIVIDILNRVGYQVDYASSATVHRYDVILVSITSDCDWWDFVAERVKWQKGNYKIIVGGAGVLNVRPFLNFVDYFSLGRAEGVINNLINQMDGKGYYDGDCVIDPKTFNINKTYHLQQTDAIYPYDIKLENGETYHEDIIGCNHRCFFCGYTWHRKNSACQTFEYKGLWNGGVDRERAMIDMDNGTVVDLVKLRTTAIDGLSERLRFLMNKKISRKMLIEFLIKLASCEKPHQVKLYNIIGLPTETKEDWFEFLEDIKTADSNFKKQEKQTSILLHSTPFRAMPATPLACKPMQYINFRKAIANTLGRGLKGNIFYQGNAIWAVESMATESLPTVIQSAIVWRGTEKDSDNFIKIAQSKKFAASSADIKQVTLEKYFDVKTLFGEFTKDTLPTRYLKTYAQIEKMW
jgi:hypothetical protein